MGPMGGSRESAYFAKLAGQSKTIYLHKQDKTNGQRTIVYQILYLYLNATTFSVQILSLTQGQSIIWSKPQQGILHARHS